MSQSDRLRTQRLKIFDAFFGAPSSPLKRPAAAGGVPEAWFLGPKAENKDVLLQLVTEAIEQHSACRQGFHPEDPIYITDAIKQSQDYRDAIAALKSHTADLFKQMQHSTPLFSMRSQGHMLWDQVLPALVGYFGAMLYNQNNVAAEASPVTTQLEIDVGNDLCRMLEFPVPPIGAIVPWGHITCDGSVANIEGAWAARNAKFFALALREALLHAPRLSGAKDLPVRRLDGETRRLVDIDDAWTLINLKIDDVVTLPQKIRDCFHIDTSITTAALQCYSVQNVGLVDFYAHYLSPSGIASPVLIAPATRHYSWPKAATLLGLGQNGLKGIHVDLQARMDLGLLRAELEACLAAKRPVLAVVAVIGSTEESAVDPLRGILDIRTEFRARGLDFAVHADAAWGGYYNTIRIPSEARRTATLAMLKPLDAHATPDAQRLAFLTRFEQLLGDIPSLPMSEYVDKQYAALKQADSVTVDPHKAGYVPYPAGALCYRNSAMRDLISLKAPVVFHSASEPTVGIYGVEGSKPGAAAAAAWLAHKVIPLSRSGYGKILGQCMWTSKRMYCRLVTMADRDPNPDRRFRITIFQMLPAEREGRSPAEVQCQKDYIAQHFVNVSNVDLLELLAKDPKARVLFQQVGSDQTILAYSFNFKNKSGAWNEDAGRLAQLNNKIFELCSIMDPAVNLSTKPLILTNSEFDAGSYGLPFLQRYSDRLGIKNPEAAAIPFLISTTMDPWTTDTIAGDFLEVVETALCTVVYQALKELDF
jgi:glutamate/tyrosine decarboxylase-like PLP-dependent enzyme